MRSRFLPRSLAVLLAVFVLRLPAFADDTDAGSSGGRSLSVAQQSWIGDFDGMTERRLIRVALPYSRTLFFLDHGRERGLTADLFRKFEEYLNKKYAKTLDNRPITVVLVPTTFDQLLPALLAGKVDMAGGGITITDARKAKVDFSEPITKPFSEVVVAGPGAPALAGLDDLSGKDVFARPSTSYYESLKALNDKFRAAGRPEINLRLLPDALDDEDKLDMVNAGLLGIVVVDEWLADVWAPLLPDIVIHRDLAVRSGGEIGIALRKQSPLLAAEINEFIAKVVQKNALGVGAAKSLAAGLRKSYNARSGQDWENFQKVIQAFKTYGDQYDFDHLMMAAQGYQESRLDQNARSAVGAIGIMQLMPDTGASMKVGDIKQAEPNIHAGVKYMDQLMTTYFPDAQLDAQNRALFAFAAYNAGPGRINKLRKLAADQGYDPNVWFNNVERVVADKVGLETVTYVRNIYKYYVSYRLAVDAEQLQKEAEEQLKSAAQ